MQNNNTTPHAEFLRAFHGSLAGIRHWQDLDDFWDLLKKSADDQWFLYTITETPPTQPLQRGEFIQRLDNIDDLLRREHQEDYCGIVYVDNMQQPAFIKIYHPGNLGVVCGFSDNPPLPGWILSRLPPVELNEQNLASLRNTKSKRRWWQRLIQTP